MKVTSKYVMFWGGIFSNFYECEIDYANRLFHSSEQLFMYLKAMHFNDLEMADNILYSKTPKEAKAFGRRVNNFDNTKWDQVKESKMMEALEYKFYCNPELKKKLLDYKDKIFVEASAYDRIWGIGFSEHDALGNEDKWGENLLGKCLNKLIEQYDKDNPIIT